MSFRSEEPREPLESLEPRRRVRVWFGSHVIADHIAEATTAARYEQAMRRRFACLQVTNEPVKGS
jgi:hypothetical protein